MLTVILVISTAVCAYGWVKNSIGLAALAKYIIDKDYTLPTEEESKACAMYAWKKMLHLK